MKITLSNGNVVEGTLDELTTAGLLPSRSMAARAVSQQLELPLVSLTAPAAAPSTTADAPAATTAKVGRPLAPLTIKIADAFDKLEATGTTQRVSIAAKDEKKARSTVYRTNRDRNQSVVANKVRVGDRIALILSK